jgi:Flp pilus assembly protein TadG
MMNFRGARSSGVFGQSPDRGASAVEAAIVTPVVLMMIFGIIEMGFLFKDYMAAAGSVRAGVRLASANPRYASFAQAAADQVALTGGAMNLNDVQQMWVYKVGAVAGTATDKPCSGAVFIGPCAARSDFADCTVCVKFKWDAPTKKFVILNDNWPANTQNACSSSSPGGPPDRIGVYIQLKHYGFTKFVFSSVNISEDSIMTFEPMPVLTGCK